MLWLSDVRFPPPRHIITWALHEWDALLREANTSIHADRYQSSAANVLTHFDAVKSMRDLLDLFFAPTPDLKALVTALCTEGEILLFPHVLMGASCGLWLRHLVAQAGGSRSI